jgi:RsmE family RNA methyltransferase
LRLTFCQKIEDALALCQQPAGFGYLPQGEVHLASIGESASNLQTMIIGPEADFSEREIAFLIENGALPITLGPTRLRTETAALAAAVFLQIC